MPKRSLQTRRLRECAQCGDGATVDADKGILRNVKVLGLDSINRRQYSPQALQRAAALYEGAKINLDHPEKDPNQSRSIRDRFGKLTGVHFVEGDGLRADLTYNPKHVFAPSIRWWAENDPSCLGLSHNATGKGRDRDGVFVVEQIVAVRSVDLVADPASTKGLFENMDPELDDGMGDVADEGSGDWKHDVADLIAKLHKADDPAAHAVAKKLAGLIEPGDDEPEDDLEGEEMDEETPVDESVKVLTKYKADPAVRKIVEQLDTYKAREALNAKLGKARKLCEAAKLPRELVTDVFLENVASQPDEKGMKAVIEDRRVVAGLRKPKSAGPASTVPNVTSTKDFANAVRRGA